MHFHAEDGSPAGSKRLGDRLAARDAEGPGLRLRPKFACNLLIIMDMTDSGPGQPEPAPGEDRLRREKQLDAGTGKATGESVEHYRLAVAVKQHSVVDVPAHCVRKHNLLEISPFLDEVFDRVAM